MEDNQKIRDAERHWKKQHAAYFQAFVCHPSDREWRRPPGSAGNARPFRYQYNPDIHTDICSENQRDVYAIPSENVGDRMFNRIHLIVLDSVGIGAQHDAKTFGDEGAHTLKHTLESHPVTLPNMESFGLGCIDALPGMTCPNNPAAFYSKMSEVSQGKDTMTGHWEIAGLNIEEPFKVYPDGFPEELLDRIREVSGRGIVGNKPASGTEIIKEYGEHQMETGDLIVYTSNDPVLQIAAHEEIIPLEELYDICEKVREMTTEPEFLVGRIIARPYVG